MHSKQFLQIGGVILLVLGVLGFVMPHVLGDVLWFDMAENWAHTVLGIAALGASMVLAAPQQKALTVVVGVAALLFGVGGFLVASNPVPNFYGVTNFEMVDNVLHLVVGVWALWAGLASA